MEATLRSLNSTPSLFRADQRRGRQSQPRTSDTVAVEPRGMCYLEFEHCFMDMPVHEKAVSHSILSITALDATPHQQPMHAPAGRPAAPPLQTSNRTCCWTMGTKRTAVVLLEVSTYRPHPPQSTADQAGAGLNEFIRSARQWIDNTPKHFREYQQIISYPESPTCHSIDDQSAASTLHTARDRTASDYDPSCRRCACIPVLLQTVL